MTKTFYLFALCAFFQCAIDDLYAETSPDYNNQGGWGGSCNSGDQQSPINIRKFISKLGGKTEDLSFDNLDLGVSVVATNNAPSVKYTISGSNRPTIYGGRLTGTYVLESFHFHWPSEHTINGEYFDLEGHFVFYSTKYSNITEAYGDANGLTVVGVFYDAGKTKGSPSLSLLANATSEISETVGAKAEIESIDLSYLIPDSSFFTYKGSLTTPECNEIVVWNVFKNPLPISGYQLEALTNIYYSNGDWVDFNSRELQPLNGRKVYYKK